MSDNESDNEYSERINEMYLKERDELKAYLEMMDNSEQDSLPDKTEETHPPQTYAYYPGIEALSSDLKFATNEHDNGCVHICAYYINKTGKAPFLQYALRKYDNMHETKKDLVTFPSFFYEKGLPIVEYCNLLIEVILASYKIKTRTSKYKGFINKGNQFYVFYDLGNCEIRCHDLRRMNDLWLVTMDEIINHKKVCNFPIDSVVTDFFSDLNNLNFTYLKDVDDNIYETPIVAYTGMDATKVDFISSFGEPPSIQEKFPELYYYFTDYQKAFKNGGFSKTKNSESNFTKSFSLRDTQGGLMRFALFTGYVKMFSDNNKINEHDNLYNSIYISDDNGHPTWVLKKYEQQCPLTCHFINKTALESEEWNNESNYYII